MLVREARASISTRRRLKLHSKKFPWLAIKMRRYALVGVLVAALSCARQATAWDSTCWDFNSVRASLWLPFSKGDIQSRR